MSKYKDKDRINVIKRLDSSLATPISDEVYSELIVTGERLMRTVVSDLEYGVSSRPSLPSCFEESSELGVVDRTANMRVSRWDLASEACMARSYEPTSPVDDIPIPEPTPEE